MPTTNSIGSIVAPALTTGGELLDNLPGATNPGCYDQITNASMESITVPPPKASPEEILLESTDVTHRLQKALAKNHELLFSAAKDGNHNSDSLINISWELTRLQLQAAKQEKRLNSIIHHGLTDSSSIAMKKAAEELKSVLITTLQITSSVLSIASGMSLFMDSAQMTRLVQPLTKLGIQITSTGDQLSKATSNTLSAIGTLSGETSKIINSNHEANRIGLQTDSDKIRSQRDIVTQSRQNDGTNENNAYSMQNEAEKRRSEIMRELMKA